MGRYAWERKCSFSAVEMIDDHTRCPESNQITHEWHSWLCFKIFLCKYLGPQDCRLCKRQWRCHFLRIPIPISERKRDRKGGRMKEGKQEGEEKQREKEFTGSLKGKPLTKSPKLLGLYSIFKNWRIANLQCPVSFKSSKVVQIYTYYICIYVYIYILFQILF